MCTLKALDPQLGHCQSSDFYQYWYIFKFGEAISKNCSVKDRRNRKTIV